MNRDYIFNYLKTTASDVQKQLFWNELKRITKMTKPCDVMVTATEPDLRKAFALISNI